MQIKNSRWKSMAPKAGWVCAGITSAVFLVPQRAHGQFGIDLAVIVAGLQKVSSLLSSAVASPLAKIQTLQADEQKFQQTVMYPIQAINSAKALASSFMAPINEVRSLMNINLASATMALPRQLESQILSGNPNNINTLSATYTQVYGPLPSQNAAPPAVRAAIDMSDAQAQDAMKKAIQLDALAARELEIAASLNQQIAQSSPGNAPILDAEASAWILQGNAYSQSAMAALLRVRSVQLSNASSAAKSGTDQTQQLHQNLLGIINPR